MIFLSTLFLAIVALYISSKYFWGDGALPFFWGIVKNPKKVGAFSPCSVFASREVIKHVHNLQGDVAILEVGGGTGQFTTELEHALNDLQNIRRISSYTLDVIEIEPTFYEVLKNKFKDNPHITIHCSDILDWQHHKQYDVIISSLPFTNISKKLVESILNKYEHMIRPNGIVSYIELMFFPRLLKIISWHQMKKELQEKYQLIAKFKHKYSMETIRVWRNIPPIYVHHLRIGK